MIDIVRDGGFILHNVEDHIGETILQCGASVTFYMSLTLVFLSLTVMVITISIYGKKWKKVSFGKLLHKLVIGMMDGAMLLAVIPIMYILMETLIYRSIIENIYIVLTRIFW